VVDLDAPVGSDPTQSRLKIQVEIRGSQDGQSRGLEVDSLNLHFRTPDIVISPCSVTGTTQLHCNIDLAGSPLPLEGIRNVTVINPDGGVGTLAGAFSVTQALSAPTVTGISPSRVTQGEVGRLLTITGSGFVETPQVTFDQSGITATSVTVLDANTLEVFIDVDLAATVGDYSVSVINPDLQTASSPVPLTVQSIGDLTVGSATPITLDCASDRWVYNNLTVSAGATLTLNCDITLKVYETLELRSTSSTNFGKIVVDSTEKPVTIQAKNLTLQSNALISADGKGFGGGTESPDCRSAEGPGAGEGDTRCPPGADDNVSGAGGGHGGSGGDGQTFSLAVATSPRGGTPYGIVAEPDTQGSGGGRSYFGDPGGNGGGAVRIEVTDILTLNGIISSNGQAGISTPTTSYGGGGGAGGSVIVTTNRLEGTGRLEANGGAGGTASGSPGGGGGGGRIAVYYKTTSWGAADFSRSTTMGGLAGTLQTRVGQAGSILFVDQSITPPSIRLGGNGQLTDLVGGTSQEGQHYQSIVVQRAGSTSDTRSTGLITISDGLTVNSDLTIQKGAALSLAGDHTHIVTGQLLIQDSGSKLIADPETSFVTLQVTDLTVLTGANLNADGTGHEGGSRSPCIAAQGPGAGGGETDPGRCAKSTFNADVSGAGGGYGGRGGDGVNHTVDVETPFGGPAYGSKETPLDMGSGGGRSYYGRSGGHGSGAMKLEVSGTLTLDGVISANGKAGEGGTGLTDYGGGGGSGGSIYAILNILQGTGRFEAKGGNGGPAGSDRRLPGAAGGGGGGGRIVVSYNSIGSSGFSGFTCQQGSIRDAVFCVSGGSGDGQVRAGANGSIQFIQADTGIPDTTAPGRITDLRIETGSVTQNSVNLLWTATGDDGMLGQAASYIIKYSTSNMTNQTQFDAATTFPQGLIPKPSGSAESITVTGLNAGTTYYFGIVAVDEADNEGSFCDAGNCAVTNAKTSTPPPDTTGPQRINNLRAVISTINSGSVVLEWTAPQDDTASEPATAFDLRYANLPIVESGGDGISSINFSDASSVIGLPLPGLPGSQHSFKVGGLASNTTYYFAIRSVDEAGNTSAIGTLTNSNLDLSCTVQCNLLTALRIGWNQVSVATRPQPPTDTAEDVFGDDVGLPVNLLRWDSAGTAVDAGTWDNLGSASTGGSNGPVEAGKGYFLFSTGNLVVIDAEDTNALDVTDPTYEVALDPEGGFNMIANPYKTSARLQDTCIRPPSGPSVPFVDAMQPPYEWVDNALYIWKDDEDAYTVATINLNDLNDPDNPALLPWKGYGIRMNVAGSYSIVFKNSLSTLCP
jgi:hypothetical protein